MDAVPLSPSEVWQFAVALTLSLLVISAIAAALASALLVGFASLYSEGLPKTTGKFCPPIALNIPSQNTGAR